MIWQIPVGLRVLAAYVVAPVLMKRVVISGAHTRKLVLQYAFSFAISLVWLLSPFSRTKGFQLDLSALLISLIGVLNGFACYSQWRAVHISMSKTYMFTLADDMFALFLGYAILGEQKYLSPLLSVGVLIVLFAAALFCVSKARRDTRGSDDDRSKGRTPLSVWILSYSVIWGAATFSMRYFSLAGVSLADFVFFWYVGSLVGAVAVKGLFGRKEVRQPPTRRELILVGQLTLAIWMSFALGYWAFMLAPITIIQPIYQVAEMILPVIIGLTVFKEAQQLSRLEKAAMAVGLVGGLIISVSFR